MKKLFALPLLFAATNTFAASTVKLEKSASIPACYQGYDVALAEALEMVRHQAEIECKAIKGLLQAPTSADLPIGLAAEPDMCGGASVVAIFRCVRH